jgi:hypothetical protein
MPVPAFCDRYAEGAAPEGAGSRTITGVLSDHQWSRGLARQNAGLRWKSAPGGRPSRTVWIHSGPGRLTTGCQRKAGDFGGRAGAALGATPRRRRSDKNLPTRACEGPIPTTHSQPMKIRRRTVPAARVEKSALASDPQLSYPGARCVRVHPQEWHRSTCSCIVGRSARSGE